MIHITDKQNCCGCTACVASCPKNCITMQEDMEGFLYPQVDADVCVNCGACERACPIINVEQEKPFEQKAYIVQHRDLQVLQESTAGGAFTAIAKYVLAKEGAVFGVTLSENLIAHHIYVETEQDLTLFRNSKYVQSSVGEETFRQVRAFLQHGRLVCFSGTPCQVEGLLRYLGKKTNNLIIVDVVCHAVPSPMIFRKYIEYQQDRSQSRVRIVRFRDKFYGYKYSTMNVIVEGNHKGYHQGADVDPWLRAFMSNICDRPSCYQCQFKKRYRVSDFTIWDCFHVGRFSKELDNDKGATRVLVHSNKGREIFDTIKDEFRYVEIDPDTAVAGAREIYHSVPMNDRRDEFFLDANRMGGTELFARYFPNTFKVHAEHLARMLCFRMGIYDVAKKLYVRVTHKY